MADVMEAVETQHDALETVIRKEYEERLEVWKVKELADLEQRNNEKVTELVNQYMLKIEKERKPLSEDDIRKLLEQEYVTFAVKLKADGKVKEFVIQELSQDVEKKFFGIVKRQLDSRGKDIAALSQSTMDLPFEEKMASVFRLLEGAPEVMAECCTIILNPDAEEDKKDVTPEWCAKNLSTWRMWNIIRAQIEVNKVRNFFSELFESGSKTQIVTNGLSTRSLQQLLQQ